LNLALVTVADLFAVMSRMEFHEADVVFDSDSAENRGPYALTTRSELPARLIEALVRPLEASAAFGRSRGSRRGIYLAMEKLASLGLVQVQPTRPKMFANGRTDLPPRRQTCRRCSRASARGRADDSPFSMSLWASRGTSGDTWYRWQRRASGSCRTSRPVI
jgi:hypothetical protein